MIGTVAKIVHSAILKILYALFFLFIFCTFLVLNGIDIDQIDLPGVKVKQFYIKFDKKFTIDIDRIDVLQTRKSGSTLQQIDRIGTVLKFLPQLFEKIQINEIRFRNERIHLLYYRDRFYLETDRLQLATQLHYDPQGKNLKAKVETLYIADPGLSLHGDFLYRIDEGTWRGEGNYDGLNLQGTFKVWHHDNLLGFDIDSKPTDSIQPLVDYLAPPPSVKVWIYPKIPAKRYRLHYLRGTVALKEDGSVSFDPTKIRGYATAYDVRVRFHDKVPPVAVERVDVEYRNDTLAFKLLHPRYEGKSLDGSSVRIRHLSGGKKARLDAHIVTDAPFDASILKILAAYRIHVPFVQTEGTTKSLTDLTIALVEGRVVRYEGDYRSEKGTLLFDHTLEIPYEKLHLQAKNLRFVLASCYLTLPDLLKANLKGTIDLKEKRADFYPHLEQLLVRKGGLALLETKNETLHLVMDFRRRILFALPGLKTQFLYRSGGEWEVNVEDLSLYRHYFSGPLTPLEGGKITVQRTGGGAFLAKGTFLYRNRILLQSGRPVERFRFDARYDRQTLTARINDLIELTGKEDKTVLRYRELDLDLLRLRQRINDILPGKNPQKSPWRQRSVTPEKSHTILIHGEKTTLLGEYAHLACDRCDATVTTRPFSLRFESRHGRGSLFAIYEHEKLKAGGKDLPDTVIHGIPALKDLHGGRFHFDAAGTLEDFNGTILFKNTLWRKSAVYNNILAALNSIPAILTLKDPGFNKEGFKIKKGVISYHYKSPRFEFREIAIHGKSANIFGKGEIDFKRESVDVKLRIQFLEAISDPMHKIPVAGYILFGKDGRISIGLSVKGKLSNPKVETSVAKDIVTAPFNILRRTITFPFHLFE